MEEKKGWLETRRYVCRKCGSSMIIESSGIRHWECTKCHTVNYEENYLENKLKQELDKAREEGYQDCMDDIWEEAKGLRSWAEHDGSISATDIEAGLQEAYLNIESKLKNNK